MKGVKYMDALVDNKDFIIQGFCIIFVVLFLILIVSVISSMKRAKKEKDIQNLKDSLEGIKSTEVE